MKPNNLIYKKGDLFSAEAEPGALNLLLHACNCSKPWGRGVAATFKEKFPWNHEENNSLIEKHKTELLGKAYIYLTKTPFQIVGLFTSIGIGAYTSLPAIISNATGAALQDLEDQLTFEPNVRIHSPKINSGLFKTPWEETEKHIIDFLSVRPDITWTVWELE